MTVERIGHVLQAFAIGDAMGMPTQLLTHAKALELFNQDGPLGDARADHELCPSLPGGTITDDTHQLLILADNLIAGEGAFDEPSFARELLSWEASMAAAGSLDLLGPSTKAALLALAQSVDPLSVSLAGTTNGGAMRIPALACAIPVLPIRGAEALISSTLEVNRLSHNSPYANLGCIAIATMISAGIDGIDYDTALDAALNSVVYLAERIDAADYNYLGDLKRLLFEVDHAHAIGGDEQALAYIDDEIGSSMESRESVVAAFAVAHLAQHSPIRAAVAGARLGGDSDTIAALASAMVAAFGVWEQPEQLAWQKVAGVNGLDFEPRARALAALRENYHDEL